VAFQLSIVQAARRAGLPVRDVRPDKDKMSRALAAAAFQQGGRLWWKQGSFGDYVAEVRAFPRGAHDDCVDTVSYACEQSIRVPRGPQLVSW
jgi:predicted phage terminase large subunit-like protein